MSTPTVTNGPLYRPAEFRELRLDPIPIPRRNYTPGPERIPLDSRTDGSAPRALTPAPSAATGLGMPRGDQRPTPVGRVGAPDRPPPRVASSRTASPGA